jgi:hypothetical protein
VTDTIFKGRGTIIFGFRLPLLPLADSSFKEVKTLGTEKGNGSGSGLCNELKSEFLLALI